MRRFGTIVLIGCLASTLLFLSAGSPLLAEEGKAESEIEALRRQNEELKKEIEELRQKLDASISPKIEVRTGGMAGPGVTTGGRTSKVVSTVVRPGTPGTSESVSTTREGVLTYSVATSPGGTTKVVTLGPDTPYSSAVETLDRIVKGGVELKKWEIENATLSHGDAGLETMLRFEKAKIYREGKKLDKAIEELQKIIDQNISEVTTHAARLSLIEILLEQKKKDQAIVEFEKILETTKDARSRRDAIYGIINLSDSDPDTKAETIDRLLENLKENPIEKTEETSPPAAL
jgi:tetratricopeptide (TPR) repeat protein